MNADLTKRLFKAIAAGSEKDLELLCRKIINDESHKGHSLLASQLDAILKVKRPLPDNVKPVIADSAPSLQSLPTSRRYQDPLLVRMEHANLRHFMVLPDSVEEKFKRIEKEFAARSRLASFGLRYKKKILLYGQPGCGKTLGAERLAWATGLPLIKVRFEALVSSYFGESGINLRAVFESAKSRPCLLFLDECDFIAKSRSNPNDVGEVPRLVNTLLQLLEDFDAPGLLVAATNLDKQLDKAIFRRFDDVFEVLPPGPSEAERLFKVTLASIQLDSNVRWGELLNQVIGMSAADIVKVAQDAAKGVILRGSETVKHMDIERAIAEIYKRDQDTI